MALKVKTSFSKPQTIIADLGIEKSGKVHAFFTNTCYKHMDKYVPMRDGDLRTNVSITTNSITYEQPYAHAQYVGYTTGKVRKYTTPGTGPYWDSKMWTAEQNTVIKEVQNYFNKGEK